MTKNDIVKNIAYRTGVTREVVRNIVDIYADEIKDCLMNGDNYYQRGFGTFELIKRKPKVARNICKRTAIHIPACVVPKFKPCKQFVKSIKESNQ